MENVQIIHYLLQMVNIVMNVILECLDVKVNAVFL